MERKIGASVAAVTAVGLLHRSLLAFGIVSRRGRKRGEDDGHGGESLEEEARVMEEAGAVDGDKSNSLPPITLSVVNLSLTLNLSLFLNCLVTLL